MYLFVLLAPVPLSFNGGDAAPGLAFSTCGEGGADSMLDTPGDANNTQYL